MIYPIQESKALGFRSFQIVALDLPYLSMKFRSAYLWVHKGRYSLRRLSSLDVIIGLLVDTLWYCGIAMEDEPFLDDLPVKHGRSPWATVPFLFFVQL